MTLNINTIELGPHFTKHLLEIPGLPKGTAVHEMRAPDIFAHSHSRGMWSFIFSGGYIEEVFAPDGTSFRKPRIRGLYYIPAYRVHRIDSHPDGPTRSFYVPDEIGDDRPWYCYRWDRGKPERSLNNNGTWEEFDPTQEEWG